MAGPEPHPHWHLGGGGAGAGGPWGLGAELGSNSESQREATWVEAAGARGRAKFTEEGGELSGGDSGHREDGRGGGGGGAAETQVGSRGDLGLAGDREEGEKFIG